MAGSFLHLFEKFEVVSFSISWIGSLAFRPRVKSCSSANLRQSWSQNQAGSDSTSTWLWCFKDVKAVETSGPLGEWHRRAPSLICKEGVDGSGPSVPFSCWRFKSIHQLIASKGSSLPMCIASYTKYRRHVCFPWLNPGIAWAKSTSHFQLRPVRLEASKTRF